jgi:hypothetical protein
MSEVSMAVGQVIGGTKFLWNLSAPVGVGQANRIDDVELVRFGYFMIRSASDVGIFSKELRDALQGMRRTGGFDNDLDVVIRAHQRHKKENPVDGKVSIAHVTSLNQGRFDGHTPWIIVNLNNFMRDFDRYPRIDLHPESGLEISRVASLLRI